MERTDRSVDTFLADLRGPVGDDIRVLDSEIRQRMPGHERHLYEGRFWGGSDQQIIGYGVLGHQNRSGKDVEWFIVGIGEQKNYISMYVNAVRDGAYLLRDYQKRLGKAKVGVASIGFESLADIDVDALMELVEEAAGTP